MTDLHTRKLTNNPSRVQTLQWQLHCTYNLLYMYVILITQNCEMFSIVLQYGVYSNTAMKGIVVDRLHCGGYCCEFVRHDKQDPDPIDQSESSNHSPTYNTPTLYASSKRDTVKVMSCTTHTEGGISQILVMCDIICLYCKLVGNFCDSNP